MQRQIPKEPWAPRAASHRPPVPVAEAPVAQPTAIELSGDRRAALATTGLAAILLLIAGLAATGSPSIVPLILLALSATVAIAALFFATLHGSSSETLRLGLSKPALEGKIETLEDLRWQARDNADHLQALLDGQSDIIVKRDAGGRITFANRAFCNLFAVQLKEVLGRPFHPKTVACADQASEVNGSVEAMPVWARPLREKIDTADGARWIEWSHRWVDNPHNGHAGIQSVGHDITGQRRHERNLARARDEARAADRAKSRFLASMSHEIRTPMNGILGMAGLLGETQQSAEQRTFTQAVRKSAVTLLELIDEILDFSKIEAGHVELARDPVDIVDCVQGAVELLAPRAYQKQLQLVWSVAPDIPRQFVGDETRLRQILLNLLGNAVKFTEAGGITVWIGAELSEEGSDRINFVIRDTGPGLSHEARSRIFMEFERAVSDDAHHESGTGLGLAIAQRLAQSMGGGISVNSKPGAGATFTLSIRLPRAQEPPQLAFADKLYRRHVVIVSSQHIERGTIANFLRAHNLAVTEFASIDGLAGWKSPTDCIQPDTVLFDINTDPVAARQVLDKLSKPGGIEAAVIAATGFRSEFDRFNKVGIQNFLVRPVRPATLLALLAGEIDRPAPGLAASEIATTACVERVCSRVLVAEDNEINALLTRTVVTRLGCEPVVVPNGREAIDEVARSLAGKTPRLDAILMDLHMPIIDGLEATAEIHRLCDDAGEPRPAIIAVTANAFQEDRDRCLAAGMDDYLSKPFEPGDLRRILEGNSVNSND